MEQRWSDLVSQFKREHFELYSLPGVSPLALKLQAGLSALKTPMCFQCENKNVNCPVCNDLFGKLAQNLPLSHHINSCIVCRITGNIMDEDNPPMMMPNGHVYSLKAMKEMAARNDGFVKCPRSNAVFSYSELRKCFIS